MCLIGDDDMPYASVERHCQLKCVMHDQVVAETASYILRLIAHMCISVPSRLTHIPSNRDRLRVVWERSLLGVSSCLLAALAYHPAECPLIAAGVSTPAQ